ncbi:metallopeptidase family protein [Kiloniella laminariae]|uniref:Metallopeptidase family protein n=1 Tax=Kiloniella laminariae TaxID=454162 RepID=A0ABT4LIU5_9PROT|nr:metallopeptidase family protein [Kiloniella laminariae]MCZ4281029.1 metallopeptidase family protein [Kiloniella laminariae]
MGQVHNIGRFTTPPEISDIEALAREAYAHIPDELRDVARQITIEVHEFPSEYMMEAMDCETPFEMLGLYQGIDRETGSGFRTDMSAEDDVVFLFRRPLLDYWCENGEDLGQIVMHVLIHEIGHHFGISEDDMDRMESRTVSLS